MDVHKRVDAGWKRESAPRRMRSQLKREWLVIYDAESGKVQLPSNLPEEIKAQWETEYSSKPELFETER